MLNIRDFTVRGEAALDRVAAGNAEAPGSQQAPRAAASSSRGMRVDFTRTPRPLRRSRKASCAGR